MHPKGNMFSHLGLKKIYSALLALLIIVLPTGSREVSAAIATPIQNVSQDPGRSVQPDAAQDPEGNVHVTWRDEAGLIYYSKGTWGGSQYSFGSRHEVGNIGAFGYGQPSIVVAPNGTVMLGWSISFTELRVKTWQARDSQPPTGSVGLDLGVRSSIAADSNSTFHIVADRDNAIQYCEYNGTSGCRRRDTISSEGNAVRADIAVDNQNNVHVVWDLGQQVRYRARSADGNWGGTENFGQGNFPQIATDGHGNVHLVWSREYDIQYCRRLMTSGCLEQRAFSLGGDVRPSVGAGQNDQVLIAWREEGSRQIGVTMLENGQWTPPAAIARGPSDPEVTARSFTGAFSTVWSLDYDIQIVSMSAGTPAPAPAPTPAPAPIPADARFFPETGQYVAGRLRSYWEQNGGLPIFGLPLEAESTRRTLDGTYRMQQFERHRLELHPENPPPYDILLGRLGGDMLYQQGRPWETLPPEQPRAGCRFFPETRHNLCQPFLGYWSTHGLDLGDPGVSERESLALFGLPLTGVNVERNADGWTGQTQWFERASFELHTENPDPYRILLGRLGAGAR